MKFLWSGDIGRGRMTPESGILAEQRAGSLRRKRVQLRCGETSRRVQSCCREFREAPDTRSTFLLNVRPSCRP